MLKCPWATGAQAINRNQLKTNLPKGICPVSPRASGCRACTVPLQLEPKAASNNTRDLELNMLEPAWLKKTSSFDGNHTTVLSKSSADSIESGSEDTPTCTTEGVTCLSTKLKFLRESPKSEQVLQENRKAFEAAPEERLCKTKQKQFLTAHGETEKECTHLRSM